MLLKNLYKIISENSSEENKFQVSIRLNKSHEIFKGHFPNNPILPGVALLEILKQLIQNHLKEILMVREVLNLKFLALVNPNENRDLVFDFQINPKEERLNIKTVTTFPDGSAVLKCNATFVAIEKAE